jgi:glutathione synthase/RimK-type ligase-like ATP-grasp enzyme
MKLGVFTAFRNEHRSYVKSCEELGIDYEIIDIIGDNWLDEVLSSDCDGFLCRTPSKFQERKNMFNERLYVVNKILQKPIYPSYYELYIHENKKMMFYFLKLNDLPHIDTHIFYRKEDYYDFLEKASYPLVFKTSIGSTSKGVEIIYSKRRAKAIGRKVFGILNNKLAKGYTPQTTGKIIPVQARGLLQKHFVLLQKFVKIKWEWRIVKIGESYFGHQKLLEKNFASGAGKKGWVKPPEELLYMIKEISEKNDFYSVSIDVFETEDNKFLINEVQSIIGQATKHLMIIGGKPGRYIFQNGKFVFEEGSFNQYRSYLLRVEHMIKILREKGVD